MSEDSFHRVDIQLYESMLKIKVPIAGNINQMKLKNGRSKVFDSKFEVTRAILKKYKDIIFWKRDMHLKRDEKHSSEIGLDGSNHPRNDELTSSQFSIKVIAGISPLYNCL